MTYVPTWAGFIYLAIVLDVWSRRVVGWAIGEQMTSGLVLAALNMAIQQRKPKTVIHHSDQGSQYTSLAFGQRCAKLGVRPSMGGVGDAYDNAIAESFFASLECELSIDVPSRARLKQGSHCSATWRAGTTHAGAKPWTSLTDQLREEPATTTSDRLRLLSGSNRNRLNRKR